MQGRFSFFKGQGRMVQLIKSVNVDVTAAMLEELDSAAKDLNVSRQALDEHNLAQIVRRPQSAPWPATAVS